MEIRGLTDECIGDYRKTAMYIAMPYCTFKCDKENGSQLCQNWQLSSAPIIEIPIQTLINRYLSNPLTEAIIFSGLEPFDSFTELYCFIKEFRKVSDDDIVIYTGYKEEEIFEVYKSLLDFKNIYIKFGRYRPNEQNHYDEILGIKLASSNQYAKKIS